MPLTEFRCGCAVQTADKKFVKIDLCKRHLEMSRRGEKFEVTQIWNVWDDLSRHRQLVKEGVPVQAVWGPIK